ncbi:4-hydroxybenzoate octaprenyltransferase [Chitinimonas koreensis]|uniref:4-hydroxybenzoate octaprenyltransferase n=1 Tax=Chitinimonas koreensis TaxID=356302 RepID=UPI0003FE9CED|nr:4-hydroxybenzoate octaprenyltransferase [Chitinimonas koreensis]QNM95653.1 4-hydroxybenzoate octaprenyltransferase [Chitinimonas koreensis]
MNLAALKDKLSQYEKLMRLDKPIGILLLLWPTLWGLWIAGYGRPDWLIVWIFALGTLLMRSAGCVINDYADRDFDGHVERTRNRPLAAGKVSGKEALILAAVLALAALALAWPLDRLALQMSIPAVLLAASYPYTKRFLPIPQAYLGLAFSFGIPMAFAAIQGKVPAVAWWLVLCNLFWVVAYDTEYAMVDKPDDLKIGIKTSAITFGRFDAEAVMVCHAVFVLGMGAIGWSLRRGLWWYAGLLVAAILMALQYRQIRGRDRQKCFQAFLDNNWVGAAMFGAVVLDYRFPLNL